MLVDLGRVFGGKGDGDGAAAAGVADRVVAGGWGRTAFNRCKVLIGNFVLNIIDCDLIGACNIVTQRGDLPAS